jgi:hypothetical protein
MKRVFVLLEDIHIVSKLKFAIMQVSVELWHFFVVMCQDLGI